MAAAILEKEHVPAPDGWTKTFTDPRLCAAIVDRLTFGGNIIETGSDSYRLASTRAAQAQNATTS
ncbi:DNA replication protein DnaC [Streptomyces sp. V4I2]|nr:DNA replication protein DnaC [Streptomyces sp. V4I2]